MPGRLHFLSKLFPERIDARAKRLPALAVLGAWQEPDFADWLRAALRGEATLKLLLPGELGCDVSPLADHFFFWAQQSSVRLQEQVIATIPAELLSIHRGGPQVLIYKLRAKAEQLRLTAGKLHSSF
jgi:hypothetical protein